MAMDIKEIQNQVISGINKLNEKNPYYTLILFMVVIFLVAYFGAIHIQLKTLRKLTPAASQLADDLRMARSNITRMPQYQQQVKQFKEQLVAIEYKVKSKEQVPVILESISKIAGRNSIKIEQIMPSTVIGDPILNSNQGEFYAVPISVEASASYHNLGRFINQLENEEMFVSIPQFTIATNLNDQRDHTVKMTLEAVVFERKE